METPDPDGIDAAAEMLRESELEVERLVLENHRLTRGLNRVCNAVPNGQPESASRFSARLQRIARNVINS